MSSLGIPQIACVMGSCTAGGAYVPAMSDECVIVREQGTIFLGGPPLVKAATGEEVTAEELGGGDLHSRTSRRHRPPRRRRRARAADRPPHRRHARRRRRPRRGRSSPSSRRARTRPSLYDLVPTDLRTPYDVREVIARLVDGSRFHEFKALYGADARLRLRAPQRAPRRHPRQQRHPVQRVRAQGRALHRALRPAQDPAAVPPEHHRLHGRPRLRGGRHRQARRQARDRRRTARVPKLTVIIGGSFGAGNYGMCGRAYSPRFLFMWPNARISVMGGEQAATVMETVGQPEVGATLQGPVRAPGPPLLRHRSHLGRRRHRPARDPRRPWPRARRAANAPLADVRYGIFRM